MGKKAKVGDVFLVPLRDGTYVPGQLVSAWNDELYVAIFDGKVDSQRVDFHQVVGWQPLFLTLTLDALLYHGNWPIIGNVQDNLAGFPQPAYKVRQSGQIYIESRDRTFSRPASPSEADALGYRSVSAPAVVEDAVRAYFGFGEWKSHFDEFHAHFAYESASLCD